MTGSAMKAMVMKGDFIVQPMSRTISQSIIVRKAIITSIPQIIILNFATHWCR